MVGYIKRPCDECPWRKDAEPGRFPPENWESLRKSSLREGTNFGPDFEDPLFACHKTPDGKERACAGWLAAEGVNHPRVRLGLMTGEIEVCAIKPAEEHEGWPEMYDNFVETMRHDMGVG